MPQSASDLAKAAMTSGVKEAVLERKVRMGPEPLSWTMLIVDVSRLTARVLARNKSDSAPHSALLNE